MDRVLDYLYGREYRGRGVRGQAGDKSGGKDGREAGRPTSRLGEEPRPARLVL